MHTHKQYMTFRVSILSVGRIIYEQSISKDYSKSSITLMSDALRVGLNGLTENGYAGPVDISVDVLEMHNPVESFTFFEVSV